MREKIKLIWESYYPVILAFISFLYSVTLWFTGNDFRAWSGRRRITEYHITKNKRKVDQYEYEGPVYARDTNIEYIGEVVNRLVSRSEINE